MTNGLSYLYHLDESIFIFRSIRTGVIFHFSMKIMSANRIAPDGMPRFVVVFFLGGGGWGGVGFCIIKIKIQCPYMYLYSGFVYCSQN